MAINKNAYCSLFLLLSVLLLNNSYSHMTTNFMYSKQILPTKGWKVVAVHHTRTSSNRGLSAGAVITGKNVWAVGYVYADDSASIVKSIPVYREPQRALAPARLQAEIERWD